MTLEKWGNGLAPPTPEDVLETLDLMPGEEIECVVTDEHKFELSDDPIRLEAIEKMRSMRIELPADYVFDRNEIYDS